MSLRINDEAPDFTAETTQGTINFHDWIGNSWAILFSHPKDFTPICTTELGYMAGLQPEFEKRNCKVLGISVDGVRDHEAWSKDIENSQGHAVNYPLVADPELKVVQLYDMLPADAGNTSEGRTAADNATARSVFVIGPDKKIKASLTYPMSTGRNFDEILRLLDSCQLTAKQQVATPVNWKQGEPVVILPSISDEAAKEKYPDGLVQISQIFRSSRAGDLVLSAEPGYDLRARYEYPEHRATHGGLIAGQMLIPLAVNFPIETEFIRSVDIFPTVLNQFGHQVEGFEIDGQIVK